MNHRTAPQSKPRSVYQAVAPFVLALAIFCAAFGVRVALFSLESKPTYATFYPAVVASLYFCGVAPGLMVALLGALAGVYLLSPPYFTWSLDSAGLLSLSSFVLTSLACAAAIHRLRSLSQALAVAHEEVQELAERHQDLYDHAPCGYYSLDEKGLFCQVNATALAWLGCAHEQVVGKLGPRDFFTAEGVATFNRLFAELLASSSLVSCEYDLLGKDGVKRRVSMSASAVRNAQGEFLRSRSVIHDISELARVRQALRVMNQEQELMLDNDLVAIVKVKDRRIVWCNRASYRMFAYEADELKGLPTRVLYRSEAEFQSFGAAAYPTLAAGQHQRAHLQLVRRDGVVIWVDISGALLTSASGESLWMLQDITAMKQQQEQVEHVAFHDGLTGLPNRLLLMDRLQQCVRLSLRTGECFVVCFVDLNGFKAINDEHGHAAGDVLLKAVAQRLQSGLRGHDTAARVGGDEFVLLLPNLRDRKEGELIVARLTADLAKPVALPMGRHVSVTASIGIASGPADGSTEDSLLAAADMAMYADKAARRSAQAL